MLIFTRQVQQAVIIGNGITLRILGVKGTQVRVSITAPKEVSVHRGEVYERIKQEAEAVKACRARALTATSAT
jgi:carbon storage regulator